MDADEGISGTSLKNRDKFYAMIAACEAGEFDLTITKSVSRFARNLADCITSVQRLKRLNPSVGVIFETDNLNTLSVDSELRLSFLATFAQEESVKKSVSMIWSLKERNKSGNCSSQFPLVTSAHGVSPVDISGTPLLRWWSRKQRLSGSYAMRFPPDVRPLIPRRFFRTSSARPRPAARSGAKEQSAFVKERAVLRKCPYPESFHCGPVRA